MMETILFSFILILIIIWIMLGILYFYMRYVSPYGILIKKNKKGNEQTKENEATKKKDGQKGEGTEDQVHLACCCDRAVCGFLSRNQRHSGQQGIYTCT